MMYALLINVYENIKEYHIDMALLGNMLKGIHEYYTLLTQ